MEDLKIFEEVSLECDEKGTMPYRGGHSHDTVGLLDLPHDGPIPFDGYRSLAADEAAARIRAAKATLGEHVVILVHHYQRDDVYQHADLTGDSYRLSVQSAETRAEAVVFCGVHFMAESADILSRPDQVVILPDLSAGCSMADMADIDQVEECWETLARAFGGDPDERVMPVTYMNSSAALKAFCGRHGGIVCTSTNARAVLEWAFERRRQVLFFPDQHLGRNTSLAMGIPLEEMPVWDPQQDELGGNTAEAMRQSRVILWKGHCSVHQMFRPEHVDQFRQRYSGIRILVHPECMMEVVGKADAIGSTAKIIRTVREAPAGTKWAIGTELHLVNRLREQHPEQEIYFLSPVVCMCATMYRIDLAHLCWSLENLAAGTPVNVIEVDDETARWSLVALERMLEVK